MKKISLLLPLLLLVGCYKIELGDEATEKAEVDDSRGQELYKQLSRGDQVIIHYQEKFKVDTKEGTRELIGLHFVSVEKVKE